jgi:hypothetical protein
MTTSRLLTVPHGRIRRARRSASSATLLLRRSGAVAEEAPPRNQVILQVLHRLAHARVRVEVQLLARDPRVEIRARQSTGPAVVPGARLQNRGGNEIPDYLWTPCGQTTSGMPRSRAYATMSAVPPKPFAGSPSQSATTRSERSTTTSPPARKASSEGS